MIIIGELINASRKSIGEAIEAQNAEVIQQVAQDQSKAGVDFIDVNAGAFPKVESKYLTWLVKIVQEVVDCPCAIDSPNPAAIEAALTVHKGTPIINSISLEKGRYERMIPIIAGTDMKVIALCMSDEGVPKTVDDRLRIADNLVNRLIQDRVKVENIFVDPLVQPLSVGSSMGKEFLNAIELVMNRFEDIHTACGLSNISYGLPSRKFLNQTFMIMAIVKGLDCVIVNPLDRKIMANIVAAETLAGKDDYCMNYIRSYRAGLFG